MLRHYAALVRTKGREQMVLWERERTSLDGLPDGAGLNMAHEAVDRHVRHRGDRVALRFVNGTVELPPLPYRDLTLP